MGQEISSVTPPTGVEVVNKRIRIDPLISPSEMVHFLLLQSPDKMAVALYARDETRFYSHYEWDPTDTIELMQDRNDSLPSPRYILEAKKGGMRYQFGYIGSDNVPDSVLQGETKIDWTTTFLTMGFQDISDYSNPNVKPLGETKIDWATTVPTMGFQDISDYSNPDAKPLSKSITELLNEISHSTTLDQRSKAMFELACSLRMQSKKPKMQPKKPKMQQKKPKMQQKKPKIN